MGSDAMILCIFLFGAGVTAMGVSKTVAITVDIIDSYQRKKDGGK